MRLDDLGVMFGTDKSSHWHGYLDFYERMLPKNMTALLEIGVFVGASLRTWRGYYGSDVKVVGVDTDCRVATLEGYYIVEEANSTLAEPMNAIAAKYGPFDAIIDDGSHWHNDQLRTFQNLWPHLKQGGIYFIEDCNPREPFPTADWARVRSLKVDDSNHEYLAWKKK